MAERSPIQAFRHRLGELLQAKFDGHYTVLAKRAGIPISSMEHYMRNAKHLPGGEHLKRIADACNVSVDYMLSGTASVRPADMLSKPVTIVKVKGQPTPPEMDRQVSIPILHCTCPKACAFSAEVPVVKDAQQRVVIPAEMVSAHNYHRLVALHLSGHLKKTIWGEGGRAVIDWDKREPDFDRISFYFDGTQHMIGHVKPSDEDRLLAQDVAGQGQPHMLPKAAKILGRVVAILATT